MAGGAIMSVFIILQLDSGDIILHILFDKCFIAAAAMWSMYICFRSILHIIHVFIVIAHLIPTIRTNIERLQFFVGEGGVFLFVFHDSNFYKMMGTSRIKRISYQYMIYRRERLFVKTKNLMLFGPRIR